MPSTIRFEQQGAGVVITWTGVVSADEIKQANEHIYAKEHLDKLHYQIWDFTNAERLDITQEDLRDFAMQDNAAVQENPNQFAVIVGSQALFRGYDRLFEIYEEVWSGIKIKTLSTVEEARAWLSSEMEQQEP